MKNAAVVIQELSALLKSFEQQKQAELDEIVRMYDSKIESIRQTLAIVQSEVSTQVAPQASEPPEIREELPQDYPRGGSTSEKVLWALGQLGGPVRQRDVLNLLQEYDKVSRGSVGIAITRLAEKGKVVKLTRGKFPRYQRAESQEQEDEAQTQESQIDWDTSFRDWDASFPGGIPKSEHHDMFSNGEIVNDPETQT